MLSITSRCLKPIHTLNRFILKRFEVVDPCFALLSGDSMRRALLSTCTINGGHTFGALHRFVSEFPCRSIILYNLTSRQLKISKWLKYNQRYHTNYKHTQTIRLHYVKLSQESTLDNSDIVLIDYKIST